ncbi:hypothetical protein F4778DRAFT_481893 [Xylariomycetidae sp. FL2044]|nr:hypothetical protein F4778DRAFT_481893 [Xylariomycetidae sp. FL2044]
MNATKILPRTVIPRVAPKTGPARVHQVRFQSSSRNGSFKVDSSHFAAGLAGGIAAGTLLYVTYLLTPAGRMQRAINKAAKEASMKYREASKKIQEKTPGVDEAIDQMKNFCYSYVSWIPGGRQYVDAAFKDVDTLREKHRDEVNKIVSDAYREFQELSRMGLSMEAASKAYQVLADVSKKLGNLAGDALPDILDNHPELKNKFGGSIEKLKQYSEQYGPEAKKVVEQTYQQVKEILSGGLSASNLDKVRQLIQDKVKQLGEEAWRKGLEQAKPYLDKNPKVKELLEKNAESLKQGNIKELFEKVKNAVETGNMSSLEDYINKAKEKAKSSSGSSLFSGGSFLSGGGGGGGSGGGLEQYLGKIVPNSSEILSKASKLKELAEKPTEEGEKLLRETMDEIKQVLEKAAEKAKSITEKAAKGSK